MTLTFRRAVLLAAGFGLLAGPAGAIAPSETADTPLERAAFIALPAIYEIQVTISVTAIVNGQARRVGRPIVFRGTGFGVGQDRVATARHLLAPPPARITEELVAAGVEGTDDLAGARLISSRAVVLRRATSDATPTARADTELKATEFDLGDTAGDVALIEIEDPAAPTLPLFDSQTTGTPVVVVGFGGAGPTTVPEIRIGTVERLGRLDQTEDERFATVVADVARGDSGAPAIAADGNVVGMVIRDRSAGVQPVMARVTTIRALLDAGGVVPVAAETTDRFRAGMFAFWRRDYDSAARLLSRLDEAYHDPALARHQSARARALLTSEYAVSGPSRPRSATLALGVIATLAAAAFGLIRMRQVSP